MSAWVLLEHVFGTMRNNINVIGALEMCSESIDKQTCTSVKTGRFLAKHMYNCHTCKIFECKRICGLCVDKCHNDHNVTYDEFDFGKCECGCR